jgi:hypothetical protein
MSRLTSKAVLRLAVVLVLLGVFTVLVSVNPLSAGMAMATMLTGFAMIALASYADL